MVEREATIRPSIGLLISLAYGVLGLFATLLAIPPGYASPLFPAAGLALAAVYVLGWRTLPWIFLGSLTLNLFIGQQDSIALLVSAGAWVAVASTLQGIAGAMMLRRVIGPHSPLDRAPIVGGFLAVGPVACLVSSSLSVAGLTMMGVFKPDLALVYWFNWWVGDVLGVLIVFPIFMALFGRPRDVWSRRRNAIVYPMVLCLPVIVYGFLYSSKNEQETIMVGFRLQAQQFADLVQSNFEQQEYLLEALSEFISHFDGHEPVDRSEFESYLEPALRRYPMIQAVEWAPRVALEEREVFLAAHRNELPAFDITEREDASTVRSAGVRPVYYPVTFIAPLEGNEPAIGFDLISNPKRKASVLKAITSGESVSSEPIRLVQGEGGQPGILLIRSVRNEDEAKGVVLTVLKSGEFLQALLREHTSIRLNLMDQEAGEVVFDNINGSGLSDTTSVELVFGGRPYLLDLAPSPGFIAVNRAFQSWWFMVTGAIAVGLLGAVMLLVTGYTARVEASVRARTADLQKERDRSERLAMQAEAANEAKSRFLSKCSHEMLTPLNGILGMLNILQTTQLADKQSMSVEMAKASADQMLGLVNSTLEYTALETDETKLHEGEFHLAAVINRLQAWFDKRAENSGLLLKTAVSADVPELVVGDESRLLQVLQLLTDNAVKFSRNDGQVLLAVTVSHRAIPHVWLQFSLTDHGPGIDKDALQHVFDPFAQGDDSLTRTRGGTGLGLTLARRIVQLMSGSIWAESEPGSGSTFHFTVRFNVPGYSVDKLAE